MSAGAATASSVDLASAPAARPAAAPALARPARVFSPWIVAAAVVVPTFMEVLDTTIANVALRYIAGGLSSPATDSEWVITSYLAANAIILPISGWLSARLGRRNYFMISIALFTISSALCGFATSLDQLILFRIIQGLAGGGLQPSSQGVLLDAFPAEQQGQAMTLFGLAALLAPVVGPTLGGWITDNIGWRWIFFINIPAGLLALGACWVVVKDPDYITQTRKKLSKEPLNFDTLGLIFLSVTMVCWEVLLSKGQEWDWFGDPFWRVQTLTVFFVAALAALIIRETRIKYPVVNFRALAERNFRSCVIIVFFAYAVLYGNTTTLPGMLQSLFGYDATTSGLVLSPAGVFAVLTLLVVGTVLARGCDARYLMAAGLVTMAVGNFWMAGMNLDISPYQVIWPRVVTICGVSMLFAPLNVAAFMYVPPELRGAAVGVLALLRNEGGSVGTSVAQTILERREQFHVMRLNEYIDRFNPAVAPYLHQTSQFFYGFNGDPVASNNMALAALDAARQTQATSLAYFDVFWSMGAAALALVLLILLMRKSVAEKGAHLAAE